MTVVEKKHKWPTKEISVSICGNEKEGFSFIYEDNGESCECVVANEPCYLQYTIKNNETQSNYCFSFDGVAFSNPFNNVITEAKIINNGNSIVLTNPFDVCKRTSEEYRVGFQFGFSFKKSPSGLPAKNLLLLSADPEVVNEGIPTLPGHGQG